MVYLALIVVILGAIATAVVLGSKLAKAEERNKQKSVLISAQARVIDAALQIPKHEEGIREALEKINSTNPDGLVELYRKIIGQLPKDSGAGGVEG